MAWFRRILVHQGEHRLRVGWRIVALVPAFAGISRAFTPIVFAVFGRPEHDALEWWLLRAVIVVVSVTLAVWVARRWIDRRAFTALGLRWNGRAVMDILVGFLISALMLAVAVGTLAAFDHVEIGIAGWSVGPAMIGLRLTLWLVAIGAAVAWSEELALRGYIPQNLIEGTGLTGAVVLSCVLYGLLKRQPERSPAIRPADRGRGIPSRLRVATDGPALALHGHARRLELLPGTPARPVRQRDADGERVPDRGDGSELVVRRGVGPEAGVLIVPALVLGGAGMQLWTRGRPEAPGTERASPQAVSPTPPTVR